MGNTTHIMMKKGKLAETLVFKNGLVNGEYIIYHENGAIESKRHFIDSKIADGECLIITTMEKLKRTIAI